MKKQCDDLHCLVLSRSLGAIEKGSCEGRSLKLKGLSRKEHNLMGRRWLCSGFVIIFTLQCTTIPKSVPVPITVYPTTVSKSQSCMYLKASAPCLKAISLLLKKTHAFQPIHGFIPTHNPQRTTTSPPSCVSTLHHLHLPIEPITLELSCLHREPVGIRDEAIRAAR